MRKIIAILTAFIVSMPVFSQLQQIPLNANDAYANQHKKDDFSKLSDGSIATHYTVWSPLTPYRITYDWTGYDNAVVKQLKFYVNNGNPSQLKYYIRTASGKEVLLYSYYGGGWIQAWQTVDLPNTLVATAFIIESSGGGDFPDDLQVYGTYTLHTWPDVNRTASPLSDLFGVVLKPWDICDRLFPEKIPVLKSLNPSRVRLYNDYRLNHKDDGSWNMNQQNGWAQVDNMEKLKSIGIATQMDYLAFPYEPYPAGDSIRLDPATYLQLARDVYDFGVDNKANGEYFKIIEVGNEMDRWYAANFDEYMDGYALAAMMSICYDGDKGKYPDVGMKASGSKAEVSICGLAEGEPYILYQIMDWSVKNRGYRPDGTIDLPFDIYSFHCYSSLEGQRQGIPGGVPPEYGMGSYMKRINEVRNRYFPWLKIHIGEWGWDISHYSSLNAPAFGPYTAHQTSGMWTVRAILLMAENGIDASSFYRIKSDYDALEDSSWIPFATMALTRSDSNGVKQPDGSYLGLGLHRTLTGDYFRQLSLLLSDGWVFDSRVSSSPIVLKFRKGASEMYVVWNKENMTVADRPYFTEQTSTYALNQNGILRRFVDDSSGVMSSETYTAGSNIVVGSVPVFIVADNNVVLPIKLISFTAEKINKSVILKWKAEGISRVEVERSGDGNHFQKMASITGNELIDLTPLAYNYYRLKLFEADGYFSYSIILRVQFEIKQLTACVIDITGRLIKKVIVNNTNRFEDQLKHDHSLPSGTYVIQYTDNKQLFFTNKIQK